MTSGTVRVLRKVPDRTTPFRRRVASAGERRHQSAVNTTLTEASTSALSM
ncbi:MAG: hypothetical protein RLZZ618_2971 [Pseudomonadota bacterium]